MPASLLHRGCASLDGETVIEPDLGVFEAEFARRGRSFALFQAPRSDVLTDRELMMGDVVNLNRFRKGKARSARQQLVAVNRHKFARPKAELLRLDAERARHDAALDRHLLADEPETDDGDKPGTDVKSVPDPRSTD